jgi:carboxyl-terminal processing protease
MSKAFVFLYSVLFQFMFVSSVHAAVPLVSHEELIPFPEHQRAAKIVTHVLYNYHYTKTPLDNELSQTILKQYLDMLDPQKLHFVSGDIKDFEQHANKIDDYLKKSNVEPLFSIFKKFRQRLEERVNYSLHELNNNFNFTIEESISLDRDESTWALDIVNLKKVWKRRVKNDFLSLKLAGKDESSIIETLSERYSGLLRRAQQLNSDDVFQGILNAYTTSIDPHSSYFSQRTSENFRIRMSLSLEGIGAILQSEDDMTLIKEIVSGGPADLTGEVDADDRIVGIGQGEDPILDVVGWRLDNVVDLIRGPKGTIVRLEVLKKDLPVGSPTQIVSIVRNTIKLEDQAAKKAVLDVETPEKTFSVGVITIPTFYLDFDGKKKGNDDYRSTTKDVTRLIDELISENIIGLIIDLRANGGGSLSEATQLTGLFIDSGPVVQVKDTTGRVTLEFDKDKGVAYDGPLAVLVDGNSASASEIFAGAIQDYNRGIVVGEPTFGKGTVQNLIDLNRFDRSMKGKLGELKTTIAQFFRVNGESTQHRGVIPDILFEISATTDERGERSLDNALPWAKIKPANYKYYSEQALDLGVVVRNHENRTAKNKAFQALVKMNELVDAANNKSTLSLVEEDRKNEYDLNRRSQRILENKIREAQGRELLPAYISAALEDDSDKPSDDSDDLEFDVLLNETARILSDWYVSSKPKLTMH